MTVSRQMAILVATVLVISVVANMRTLASVDRFRAELSNVRTTQDSLETLLRTELANIRSSFYTIEQDARWYTPPRVEFTEADYAKPPKAELSWTFRELSEEAEVRLSYRLHEGDWHELVPERLYGNTFLANIPLEHAGIGPAFEHSLSRSNRPQLAEMRAMTGFAGFGMQYVIHAKEGDKSLSGDTEYADLHKLVPRFAVDVTEKPAGKDGTVYSVVLRQISAGLARTEVRDVKAELYVLGDGNPAVTETLVHPSSPPQVAVSVSAEGEMWTWLGDLLSAKDLDPTSLKLNIRMSDGSVVTEEIDLR